MRRTTLARASAMWLAVSSELRCVSGSANDAGRGFPKVKGGEDAALLPAEMPSGWEPHWQEWEWLWLRLGLR